MGKSYFSLETSEANKLTKGFQFVLGILCILVAIVWLVISFNLLRSDFSLWFTIIFLLGFGYYQIISGLGRAAKFIEISQNSIAVKKSSFLPVTRFGTRDIQKIELFPLAVFFYLNNGKKFILRFGTMFTNVIVSARKAIETFAAINNIQLTYMTEEINQ